MSEERKDWHVSVKVPAQAYDALYRAAVATHDGNVSALIRDVLQFRLEHPERFRDMPVTR